MEKYIEGLSLIERRSKIVELVNERQQITTSELSSMFRASLVTIRNDLNALSEKRLLVKTHGGAVSCSSVKNLEIPAVSKYVENTGIKEKMGKVAASMINDNDIIILDSGSTVFEVAKHITAHNVTVITNDLKTAYYLAENTKVKLMICGGTVVPNLFTVTGHAVYEMIKNLHVDKLFIGCDAVSFDKGVTDRSVEEVPIKRAMISSADEVVLISDHSKIGRKMFSTVCTLDDVDKWVVDKMISSPPYIDVERKFNLQLIELGKREKIYG